MRVLCVVLVLAFTGPLAAQEKPAEKPAEKPVAKPVAPKKKVTRADVLKTLNETVVHFDFRRAPLGDIVEALGRASGIRVRIGRKARKALERRKFKMKYVADRRGDQVLSDLSKAAALDFIVTAEGAYLDVPKEIRRLRKKLGLPGKATRLKAADVKKMLTTKALSLAAVEQPLREVLSFLRKETGVKLVLLADELSAAKVTLTATSTPLGNLLDQICATQGLAWLRQGSVIVVDVIEKIEAQKKASPKKAPPKKAGE
jgi:hypothetical protein